MKILLTATTAGALLLTGERLATDYTKERTLKIESTSKLSSEVTAFSMTVDGEEREGRGGATGAVTETERTVEFKDTVLAHKDGAPTKVKREFVEIGGTSLTSAGERESERELESALEGVTLELTLGEDGVEADVVDGGEPPDAQLVGHALTLSLDALLPREEVEGGAEWELDGKAIATALGLNLEGVLYMRPERDGEGGGERPERGGGGGRQGRRGFGGGGGGLTGAALAGADWEGKAKLTAGLVEYDGAQCREIELELEASGALPEPERPGGGRDRAFGVPASRAPRLESNLELELEGRLLFDVKSGRPVLLELEGEFTLQSDTERDLGDRSMTMSRTTEGTLSFQIEITED